MKYILAALIFISTLSSAAEIAIDGEKTTLRHLVIQVADVLTVPIFIAEGVDSQITVINKNLTSENALSYLTEVVERSGFVFEVKQGGIFITAPELQEHPLQVQTDGLQDDKKEQLPPPPMLVTRLYGVQAENLLDIQQTLSQVFQQWGANDQLQQQRDDLVAPTVSVSVTSNALLVTATVEQHRNIKVLVKQLDVTVRQVHVEAVIFETTNLQFQALGFDARFISDNGFSLSYGLADALNVVVPGVGIGYSKDGSIKGLLTALETDNDARILSTPTIRVVDRETADIEVGQEIPFIVSKTTNEEGRTINEIIRRTVGLTLSVRPVVSGDNIRLELKTTAGSLSDDSSAADVITNNRSISTIISAKDGELVYLGGLLQEDTKHNQTGVPGLQHVPLIGGLFGRKDDRTNKTKLSVFIKPRII